MTDDPSDFPLKNGPAAILRRMAEAFERNPEASFGGLAVVIPPEGGTPIEMLVLDASTPAAQFWSIVQTRIQITLKELEDRNRQQWGR